MLSFLTKGIQPVDRNTLSPAQQKRWDEMVNNISDILAEESGYVLRDADGTPSLEAHLTNDLGMTSLDVVSSIMDVEERLLEKNEIPNDDANKIETVGDLASCVWRHPKFKHF